MAYAEYSQVWAVTTQVTRMEATCTTRYAKARRKTEDEMHCPDLKYTWKNPSSKLPTDFNILLDDASKHRESKEAVRLDSSTSEN